MTDPANVVYGRLKEAAHISGYAFARTSEWLETLLADDAWQHVGPGFGDINMFLRSIDLSPFNIGESRPAIVRRIRELQPDASKRAIASAVGANERTVRRDLSHAADAAPEPPDDNPDLLEQIEPAADAAPSEGSQPTLVPDGSDSSDERLDEPADEPERRSSYEQRRSTNSTEWYTPLRYITAARRVLGRIDLDPASCIEADLTVRAAHFWTEDDDGLAHDDWKGTVWLNPPYSGLAGEFVNRLVRHYERGDVAAGIALISALTTDTGWFRQLWNYTLCFVYGRIKFDGLGGSSNTAGSVFAYLGPDPDLFQEEFAQFGAIVERRRSR